MGKKIWSFLFLIFFIINYVNFASGEDLPSCVSYAQEVTQQVIDEDLIFHLLSTCPKLRRLVYRLQDPVRYGKNIPTKILLVGPPGVGKTTLSKGIAALVGRPYKFLRASLLVNEYKNSGPQNLAREIMPILQSGLPYVIIVDEIHSLCENHKKEQNADPGTAEALWSILDECSKNPQILFIGTTNDATVLPEPLKTRFANGVIEIPLPNLVQRKRIIKYYLRNTLCDFDDYYITKLAKKTNHLAGRNLEQLVGDALLYALDRADIPLVKERDFERALREMNNNEHSLQLTGLGKYAKFLKDHANLALQALNIALGLGLQYWSMQRQMTFQKTAQAEQKKTQDEFQQGQQKQQKEWHEAEVKQREEWHNAEEKQKLTWHNNEMEKQKKWHEEEVNRQTTQATTMNNLGEQHHKDQLSQSSKHSLINMGVNFAGSAVGGAISGALRNDIKPGDVKNENGLGQTAVNAATVATAQGVAKYDIWGNAIAIGKKGVVLVKAHPIIAGVVIGGTIVIGAGYCVYKWYHSEPKSQPQPSPA